MSSKEYGYIEANLGSLQGRKENLDFESYSFESGFGVEKEIREKFPVAKDGEEVIIFTESGDLDKEADFFDGESGIWSKIVNFLGI